MSDPRSAQVSRVTTNPSQSAPAWHQKNDLLSKPRTHVGNADFQTDENSEAAAGDGKKTSPAAYTLAGVAARPGGTAASASSWCAARSTSPSPPRRSVRQPCKYAPCSSSLFEKMLSRAGSFAPPRCTHFWRTAERSLARRARPRVIRSMRRRRKSGVRGGCRQQFF